MMKKKITVGAYFCVLLCVVFHSTYKRLFSQISSTDQNLDFNEYQNATNWLKDWHDYEEIETELNKTGLGEVGKPANFEDYRKELYNKYGFEALLSDSISLQRSVPDARTTACKNITYLSKLPLTAIIIIFHNERLSVLLRTVYSILNRTPAELLEEIILVDDGSTWPDMHEDLEQYMQLHFSQENSKVQLIRLPKRSGLMAARMAGARAAAARSEVLIFLDSHFEVGYNWLPPLLEPIEIDSKTCTCPIIDRIAFDHFAYTTNLPWRGFFTYELDYHMRPLRAREREQPEKNFKNYVMMGGAMAIGRDFFWQLGGFDEGMTNWGGEQFEMSFKIWMCGGQLLDVPCSRIGHLFRDTNTQGNKILYGDYSFVNRNYKRFLDVWVEPEYRDYFYQRRPTLREVDAGDLTTRIEIRQRLQCKNFSWMLENVMPDLHDVFLPIEPAELASGLIRSVYDPTLCLSLSNNTEVVLEQCRPENEHLEANKSWHYTWRGEFRILDYKCLESDINTREVTTYSCHMTWGNQKWYYNRENQWIQKFEEQLCIHANAEERRVQLTACDVENLKLKWTFSKVNDTAMEQWDEKLKSDLNY